MKSLTIKLQRAALIAAVLGLSACKVSNPDQEIVISPGSKGAAVAAEPVGVPAEGVQTPPVIYSTDVVIEEVQPPVPAPDPAPEPTGPRMKALADCKGYFAAGAVLFPDGTVELAYSSIQAGVVYPLVVGGYTYDTQNLWALDLGNGRVDYFLGNCLEKVG
jgi:hypothetical protein